MSTSKLLYRFSLLILLLMFTHQISAFPFDITIDVEVKNKNIWPVLETLAIEGDLDAQVYLGTAYLEGKEKLPRNDEQAKKWLRLGEKRGSFLATYWLAKLEQSENNWTYTDSLTRIERLAKLEFAAAEYDWGLTLLLKDFADTNSMKKWFGRAASKSGEQLLAQNAAVPPKAISNQQSESSKNAAHARAMKIAQQARSKYLFAHANSILASGPNNSEEQRALDLLEEAESAGHAHAKLILGKLVELKNYPPEALREYLLKWIWHDVQEDVPMVLHQYSLAFFEGKYGFAVDVKKGREFLKSAVARNDPYALCDLGYYHKAGEFEFDKNLEFAIKYFKKAAELDHAECQYYLANELSLKAETREAKAEAVSWMTKSAEKKHGAAQLSLAFIYTNGKLGVDIDRQIGRTWLERAAGNGSPWAQYAMGVAYRDGHFGNTNTKRSEQWLQRALSHGISIEDYESNPFWRD